MAKVRRVPQAKAPLKEIEIGEPPPITSGRRLDPLADFAAILEQVRKLEGRSAKIMQHPDCREIIRKLKERFPEFDFASRTIEANGKAVMAVWARLIVPAPESPPAPKLPSTRPMTEPLQG